MTALLLAALLAVSVHEEARYVMGTMATIRAEAMSAETAEAACDTAFAEIARLEAILSTWRRDSDISRLNAAPADSCVPVAAELVTVVDRALQVAAATDGAFDPTVLPLVKAWGLRGGGRVPTAAELAELRTRTGADLVLTGADCVGRIAPGVELDLGGIAKGYALDRARAAMAAAGAVSGVLDLGGNLLVFGPDRRRTVLVAAPDGGEPLAEIPVGEGSAATSGQYERFVEIDGERYGHILDPRSGRPVARRGSVTVTAPAAWLADALATAAFVMGPEAGPRLAAAYPEAVFLFVLEDGRGWIMERHAAGRRE